MNLMKVVKSERLKELFRVVENVISRVEIGKIGSREWQRGMFLVSRLEFEHMMGHCCNRWKGAKKIHVNSNPCDESIGGVGVPD